MTINTLGLLKRRIGISQRIVHSFVLLLVISFCVALFNSWGLRDFHQRFITFKKRVPTPIWS